MSLTREGAGGAVGPGGGDASAANQVIENNSLASIDTKVTGLALDATLQTTNTRVGDLTEAAPATDTASSGLNGRLQRIAQRITSLIAALGSPFQAGGSIGNTAFGVNNAAGGSAVNVQDGGNSLTVDNANLDVALSTRLKPADTLAAVTSITNPVAVTNAGLTNLDVALSTRLKPADTLAAVTSITNPVAVTQSTSPWVVAGGKTPNAAGPGATNLGTLPAVATAVAPTYTEGNQVGLSTDLSGQVRISGTISASSSAAATEADPTYVEGTDNAFSQDLNGHLRTLPYGLVTDTPAVAATGTLQRLVLTSEGRLQVSSEAPPLEVVLQQQAAMLSAIYTELRVITEVLQRGLNINDDMDQVRTDTAYQIQ